MVRKTTLGVITVVTNKYVDYWIDQAKSFAANPSQDLEITLHVFTDQLDRVKKIASTIPIRIVAYEIPSYRWPEASLYRFKIMHEFRDNLNEDLLMHLDADMLVEASLSAEELRAHLSSGICLVRHPGYYRPVGLAKVSFYLQNPLAIFRDVLTVLKAGSLGAWETRTKSLAFVPRSSRKEYFCGATWWGLRADILRLSENLSSRISHDEETGVMAVWHDESHLNWWASENLHGKADSRYCFSVGYPQLKGVPNIIQAVHK